MLRAEECSEQRMLHTSELQLSAPQLCSHRKGRFGFACTFQKHCSLLIQTWKKLPKANGALSLGVGGQSGVGVSPHLAGSDLLTWAKPSFAEFARFILAESADVMLQDAEVGRLCPNHSHQERGNCP